MTLDFGLREVEHEMLVVIVTNRGMHEVADLPADQDSLACFRLRLADTEGWHGIIVSTPPGQRGDPVYGFFECVLAKNAGTGAGRAARRVSTRRPGGRKSRWGR